MLFTPSQQEADNNIGNFGFQVPVVQINQLGTRFPLLYENRPMHLDHIFLYDGIKINDSQNSVLSAVREILPFNLNYKIDQGDEESILIVNQNIDRVSHFEIDYEGEIFVAHYSKKETSPNYKHFLKSQIFYINSAVNFFLLRK